VHEVAEVKLIEVHSPAFFPTLVGRMARHPSEIAIDWPTQGCLNRRSRGQSK
jgi:hypothetical protein